MKAISTAWVQNKTYYTKKTKTGINLWVLWDKPGILNTNEIFLCVSTYFTNIFPAHTFKNIQSNLYNSLQDDFSLYIKFKLREFGRKIVTYLAIFVCVKRKIDREPFSHDLWIWTNSLRYIVEGMPRCIRIWEMIWKSEVMTLRH